MAGAGRISNVDQDGEQRRIREKIAEIDAVAEDFPAVLIIHDIRSQIVKYMSPRGRRILGVDLEELERMGTEYYTRFFNPEDAKDYVPRIFGMLTRNNCDEVVSFFQQVRASEAHPWAWYFSTTKILLRDGGGLPLLTLTQAYPVDPSQDNDLAKAEANNFYKNNIAKFATLTDRECSVLRLLALGKSLEETATELSVTVATVEVCRGTIKHKLKTSCLYELTRFAKAFNLI